MTIDEIKKIAEEALEVSIEFIDVEATLYPKEFYLYTGCWTIKEEQLNKIRSKVRLTEVTADGGQIMLTVRADY